MFARSSRCGRPNMRLKLAGAYRFRGSGVFAPERRSLLLRRRASRPQLKRDPLDGTAEQNRALLYTILPPTPEGL